MRLVKNVIENPSLYLKQDFSSQYSKFVTNYYSQIVNEKIEEFGEFKWNDKLSQRMI